MKTIYQKIRTILDSKIACILGHLYMIGAFALLDYWLRRKTQWIGFYDLNETAPNLFTLLWAVLLTALLTSISSRKIGRIVYGVVYYLLMIYAVVQYGAMLILGKFLYFSDFLLAGEGADYASWVVDMLTPSFLIQVFALIGVGIVGIFLFPKRQYAGRIPLIVRVGIVLLCIAAMIPVPKLYGELSETAKWDSFQDPAYEYQQFTNSNYDMELTGMYQYMVRDMQVQLNRGKNRAESLEMVTAFFDEKAEHTDNEWTGIFEGKNVIVVMMETMDDWVITAEDTPTLYRMMSEGINFTNFYTPQYSNGYTFNTEFAFNVSVYPYSNGNSTSSLLRNTFDSSIASRFAAAGYRVNSYHVGDPNFYNRGKMHEAWGYEAYHSYPNYPKSDTSYYDDRFLTESDALYGDLTSGDPFFSFVITYSPHLPYNDDDSLSAQALQAYPQYDVQENREVAILRAKAKMTDDMFAALLDRLEADGLLENTVIVGFCDHYAYGLSDKEILQQLSEDAGSSILEKTPAFIYCAGSGPAMQVDQVVQITDLAPTVLNLLGLEVPREIMGQDVFASDYKGLVVFAGSSWLTDTTYVRDGSVIWNNGMSSEEMMEINAYVQRAHQINDAILDTDYYAGK